MEGNMPFIESICSQSMWGNPKRNTVMYNYLYESLFNINSYSH